MKKVEGADYLYRHGNQYLVRMQVPPALKKAVGQGALKKSLGADLAAARRASHSVIAEFQFRIETARGHGLPERSGPAMMVDEHEIEKAVYAHFRRMAIQMRGKLLVYDADLDPDPALSPRQRRIRGFEQFINLHLDALARGDYGIMGADARWMSEDNGWSLDPKSHRFRYLCECMVRARLEIYRDEMRRLQGDFSERKDADPLFGATPPKPADKPRMLGDLIDKFNGERERDWSTSTKKNYTIITRVIEEVCGRDTLLAAIDKDFCRNIRDTLIALPSNYQKKAATKGRSITEVIEIAKARNMPLLQPATVNAHLNKFGAIIRFGRDEGWIVGNPMAGIEVSDPVNPNEKRDPFSISQLQAIFACEPWASRMLSPDDRPSRFWVPLIALFTGARLGEICGLQPDDFTEKDGFTVVDIRDRVDQRRTKDRKSRTIPVHSALQKIGLLDYVAQQRSAHAELLFPEEKANTLDHWGDAVSDWFGRLVQRLEFKGRKLTMHSFRHSFEDALREADLHDTPIGNALTGRRGGGISANYGSRFSTAKLAAAIEQVRYRELSLAHLVASKQATDDEDVDHGTAAEIRAAEPRSGA